MVDIDAWRIFYDKVRFEKTPIDLYYIEPGHKGGGGVTETNNTVVFIGSLIITWIRV